jgi:carbon storage regulator
MLVLSRRRSDKIQIGDNITITIVEIRGNAVRIGIDAPKEINVVRDELIEPKRTYVAVKPPSTPLAKFIK